MFNQPNGRGFGNPQGNPGFGGQPMQNPQPGFGQPQGFAGGGMGRGGGLFSQQPQGGFGQPSGLGQPSGFGAQPSGFAGGGMGRGGGLFSQQPQGGFGAAQPSGFGGFGTQATPSTGFQQTSMSQATTFGQQNPTGTKIQPYTPTTDSEPGGRVTVSHICAMNPYQSKSIEELRLEDYKATTGNQPSTSQFPGQQTGGLFSQQANPPAIGQPQGQTPFGQGSLSQQTQPGSLFSQAGAQKPQGSMFSQPQPTPQQTGLFSQQPQTGSLFGQSQATPSQPQQTGSLFSQQPQTGSLFGQSQATPSQPQQTGSLFGQQPQTGSLFSQQPQTGSLFGQSQTGSLFSQSTQPTQQSSLFSTQPTQQSLLFSNVKPSFQTGQPQAQFTQPAQGAFSQQLTPQHPLVETEHHINLKLDTTSPPYITSETSSVLERVLRHQKSSLKQRSTQTLPRNTVERFFSQPRKADSLLSSIKKPESASLLKNRSFSNLRLDKINTPPSRRSSTPVPQNRNYDIIVVVHDPEPIKIAITTSPETIVYDVERKIRRVLNVSEDTQIHLTYKGVILQENLNIQEIGVAESEEIYVVKDLITKDTLASFEELPKLHRSGYKMKPSIIELARKTKSELQKVPNFTVENENGKIVFEGETDVTGLDIDKILEIGNRVVVVYPDDSELNKPQQGKGLNKPAIIHLYNCKPRKPYEYEAFKKKLKEVCEKNQSAFINWNENTFEWVFRVNHF